MAKSASLISAQADDTVTYRLVYQNLGSSPVSPVTVTDLLPPISKAEYVSGSATDGGAYDASTGTLQWILPVVSPGESATLLYALQMKLQVDGEKWVTNNARLDSAGGSVLASAKVRVFGSVRVKIAVYNAAGELVKTLVVFDSPHRINSLDITDDLIDNDGGSITLSGNGTPLGSWDGTNQKGQIVANGTYFIKMDSIDSNGEVYSVSRTVAVQLETKGIEVTVFNAAGEVVRRFAPETVRELVAGFDGTLDRSDFQVGRVRLAPDVIAPTYMDPNDPMGSAALTFGSGRSMAWNGRNDRGEIVASGTYFVVIRAWEGGRISQTVNLTVNVKQGETSIMGRVFMAPNPLRLRTVSEAVFYVGTQTAADRTTVRIYTSAGERVAEIASNPGVPGRVVWRPDTGPGRSLATGNYLAVVELWSGSARVDRRIINIHVLR